MLPRSVLDLEVISDPATAVVALEPVRARLLAELSTPGSATTLAQRLGLARQKVNYHLHALEAQGLVRLQAERQRRGLTERVLIASAASYVVSPAALGAAASDPERAADHLSARYLIALAARVIREVGDLVGRADAAGKRLPTLGLDTQVSFASAEERAAFTRDLSSAVTELVARYSAAREQGGRTYRLVVAAHPLPRGNTSEEEEA